MKKMLAILAAAAMLCGMTTVSAAETYQKGDVNMDGKITVEDAQLVLEDAFYYYMGLGTSFSQEQASLATISGVTTKGLGESEALPYSICDAQIILIYTVECLSDPTLLPSDFFARYEDWNKMYGF